MLPTRGNILDMVYASNATRNMLTGKVVSRAVRSHMLVDAALNTLLVANACGIVLPSARNTDVYLIDNMHMPHAGTIDEETNSVPLPVDIDVNEDEHNDNDKQTEQQQRNYDTTYNIPDLKEAKERFEVIMSSAMSTEQASNATVLKRIKCKLDDLRQTIASRRTSQLWLQYMV